MEIEPILQKYPDAKRDALIPLLQEVQEVHGFLSKDAIVRIGRHLGLPASKVYGVATFYNQFRFQPIGRFHVQVCRGTACHVKGSANVLDEVVRQLGIGPGQTSRDRQFSIEVVACMGSCGLSPVICINGEYYAQVTPARIRKVLASYRKQAAAETSTEVTTN
jgi:NADH-quinone oxidoreductase E subunit